MKRWKAIPVREPDPEYGRAIDTLTSLLLENANGFDFSVLVDESQFIQPTQAGGAVKNPFDVLSAQNPALFAELVEKTLAGKADELTHFQLNTAVMKASDSAKKSGR